MDYKSSGHIAMLLLAAVILMATGCSSQKNTAKSRFWHAFNARYNTYYNGTLAYIDGSLEKETGNVDNFTELIPLYTVGNKNSRELGKSNYDKAIEKCEKAIKLHSIKRRPEWTKSRRKTPRDLEWLSRKEYNPFLWKAWMLMGRSQFYEGDFEGAASTFSYMSRLYSTQPAIYGKARAWLAKCYVEADWLYDAEDVIRNIQRDSIHWRARKEWDYTYADYYIHTGEYSKAIPYLRKAISHEMRRKQKAREWFLLGQLYSRVGNRDMAYKAYKHVVRLNPPYQVEFNARIAMTEVLAGQQGKKMIRKLRHMAASDNNKDYLDQVYYAIGNIYLSQKDTLSAISAYEKGNSKGTRSGIEKGVLLLKLGDLYWEKDRFSDAKRCYDAALGMLDKDRDDYQQLSDRSKVLDDLVPYTDAVHLQDSLQSLAKMDEKSRNEAIDRVIAALKKKEKEERDAAAEAKVQETQQRNNSGRLTNNNTAQTGNTAQKGAWYFYNATAVSNGKRTFQQQWGNRPNADNWQRINQTVVAGLGDMDSDSGLAMADSLAQDTLSAEESKPDSAVNDPHKREYYLAQIPFTEDQLAESNGILSDGLYHSGVIFKDKLDNLPLSERTLNRLLRDFPDFEHNDEVYYHLYLLHSRKGEDAEAALCLDTLKEKYPTSEWTKVLTNPYFKENAMFGTRLEDSLYAATYEAFKADRFSEVSRNNSISEERFPDGANRDKFIFVSSLSLLNDGDSKGCLEGMKTVVQKYPQSRLAEMAGMIINGVNEGRQLHGAKFDLGDVWSRRTMVLNDSDSINARQFTPERNADFNVVIVYMPDSVNENQLLFNLARYNFTSYLVRNFDISIEDDGGLHRMRVSGFRNYDEALQYARQLYRQQSIVRLVGKARSYVISNDNLSLIGQQFSYNDYDQFYTKHFAPLKVSTFQLLTEPAEIVTEPGDNAAPTQEDIDRALDDGNFIDNGLDIGSGNQGTTIIEQPDGQQTQQETTTVVAEPEQQTQQQGTTVVAEPEQQTQQQGTTVVAEPEQQTQQQGTTVETQTEQQPQQQGTTVETEPEKTDSDEPEIYFGNDAPASNENDNQQQKPTLDDDLDDEYYDLDGF